MQKLTLAISLSGGAGGKKLVEEGALKGVTAVHGLHVWPPLPAGTLGTRVRACIEGFVQCAGACLLALQNLLMACKWACLSHPCFTGQAGSLV